MHIPGLTEATIQEHTADGSFERGRQYFERGAVQHIEQRGQEITARVKGSHYIPYAVHVSFNRRGITDVECTCPYHEGAWCKHIVATLLTTLQQNGEVAAAPALRERLRALNHQQLVDLVEQLADADPAIVDDVERALDAMSA